MPETVSPSLNGNGAGAGVGNFAVHDWQVSDVLNWALGIERCSKNVANCLQREEIDGEVLLTLTEADIRDFRYRFNHMLTFSELKKLWLSVEALQQRYVSANSHEFVMSSPMRTVLPPLAVTPTTQILGDCGREGRQMFSTNNTIIRNTTAHAPTEPLVVCAPVISVRNECPPTCSSPCVNDAKKDIPPEFFKTAISLGYSFAVTWITSFVMVIVHERVPDMKRYPPLPDIFLDNVPHIPWAFHMCEITGTLLFAIWSCVIILHKHRTVLLRRFFALAGTVFLLRCVTMLITSLSVPGTHLQCDQSDYAIDDAQ